MCRKSFIRIGIMIGLSLIIILGIGCTTPLPATEITPTPLPENTPTESAPAGAGGKFFRDPHPILGDVRVRRAIAYCTDRAALIRSVYSWLTDLTPFTADSFVPPGHWAYARDDPGFVRYPFDPERGKTLLDEAGWRVGDTEYRLNADGEELALKLTTTSATFRQTWAAVWEEQMKACGIRIVRFHTPASWFFGATTGLSRRDFEIAAFAWVTRGSDIGGLVYPAYSCEQIPLPANNWQGQNYTGWCNETAEAALRTATTSLRRDEQRASYVALQREYTRDVPVLPLFYRVDVFAINRQLENFIPPTDGIHTWNAEQWRIPDKDTIVIGEDAEPASLSPFAISYVTDVIRTLVNGRDVSEQNNDYIPVLLKEMPSVENGRVQVENVIVKEEDTVIDWTGKRSELKPGVVVLDAAGRRVVYQGGELAMRQLLVTYEFVDGLKWSDGEPVSKADYELAYRAMCDPAIRGEGPFTTTFPDPFPACDQIADVEFSNETAYRVKWHPGSIGSTRQQPYFLPPFSRVPAHQITRDGRKLGDVPFSQWDGLDEVHHRPLGVGPYMIKEWVYGERIVLEANPHYFRGTPATPNIIVKFLRRDQIFDALLAGEVDILDWETIGPQDIEDFQLIQTQEEGKVRLIILHSATWEHLDFALFVR
jgi:ABC-type transport system substrate-binding protein